jgi:hypothetical protein
LQNIGKKQHATTTAQIPSFAVNQPCFDLWGFVLSGAVCMVRGQKRGCVLFFGCLRLAVARGVWARKKQNKTKTPSAKL